MLLLLHVISALAGLCASTAAVFQPSVFKLRLAYSLVVSTIVTGTILVIASHAEILSSCIAGLAYVAVSMSLIVSAQRRLSKIDINTLD